MSFRRPKENAREAMRWREFVSAQRGLFADAGMPGALTDRTLFDDFLMHAFVAMPGGLADGTRFDLDELDRRQRRVLGRLVDLYLVQFPDPGVTVEIDLVRAKK